MDDECVSGATCNDNRIRSPGQDLETSLERNLRSYSVIEVNQVSSSLTSNEEPTFPTCSEIANSILMGTPRTSSLSSYSKGDRFSGGGNQTLDCKDSSEDVSVESSSIGSGRCMTNDRVLITLKLVILVGGFTTVIYLFFTLLMPQVVSLTEQANIERTNGLHCFLWLLVATPIFWLPIPAGASWWACLTGFLFKWRAYLIVHPMLLTSTVVLFYEGRYLDTHKYLCSQKSVSGCLRRCLGTKGYMMWTGAKLAIEEKPVIMTFLITILLAYQITPVMFGNQTKIEARWYVLGALIHQTIYFPGIIFIGIYAQDASEAFTSSQGSGSITLIIMIVIFVLLLLWLRYRAPKLVKRYSNRAIIEAHEIPIMRH